MQDQSALISYTLDQMGYNLEMVLIRRELYQLVTGRNFDNLSIRTTGSLADGTSKPYEADLDILLINEGLTCVDTVDKVQNAGPKPVFLSEQESVSSPEYIRLRFQENCRTAFIEDQRIVSSILEESQCLRSVYYMKRMEYSVFKERRSDSVLRTMIKAYCAKYKPQFVLRLEAQSSYDSFLRRDRVHQWPSDDLMNDIAQAELLLIPASKTRDQCSDCVWEICHAFAEQKLFESLNITQVKLYILLKMIAKETLYPISKCISSYVLKNVLFWMCQLYPEEGFVESRLVDLLILTLSLIYIMVKCREIPCFIMPKKNLIARDINFEDKFDLLRMLSILREERAAMFVRCDKLRCVMMAQFTSPDVLDTYKTQRDRLEQLVLSLNVIQSQLASKARSSDHYLKLVATNNTWQKLAEQIYDSVLPDWRDRRMRKEDIKGLINERIKKILG